jgi:hypothetical protein
MLLSTIVADELRLLAFRRPSPAISLHFGAYLVFGLFFTWLAGVGRYWDNPKAYWWQSLGLGSLAYVFVLALLVWVLLGPLRPKNWSYRSVLLFITLTAPPAVLYAIPVEKFMTVDAARTANAWFLGIVASWRVALFAVYLCRVSRLEAGAVIVASLLPLAIIVVALSVLNLEHVVFDLMSGIREEDRSSADTAYTVVFVLSMFSFFASPFLIVGYLWYMYRAWRGA